MAPPAAALSEYSLNDLNEVRRSVTDVGLNVLMLHFHTILGKQIHFLTGGTAAAHGSASGAASSRLAGATAGH